MRTLPHFLGGPLLYWEVVRTARRRWLHVLRFCYAGFLCVQFFVYSSSYRAEQAAIDTARRDLNALQRIWRLEFGCSPG